MQVLVLLQISKAQDSLDFQSIQGITILNGIQFIFSVFFFLVNKYTLEVGVTSLTIPQSLPGFSLVVDVWMGKRIR